jgi:hypothetical protein
MSSPIPDLTPLGVLVALLTMFVGPVLAPLLGAYSLIVVGWFGGVLIGIYRQPPGSRIGILGFLLVSLIVTLGATVSAADVLSAYMPLIEAKALLFPIAVMIPAIGHSWVNIAQWCAGALRRRFMRNKQGKQ